MSDGGVVLDGWSCLLMYNMNNLRSRCWCNGFRELSTATADALFMDQTDDLWWCSGNWGNWSTMTFLNNIDSVNLTAAASNMTTASIMITTTAATVSTILMNNFNYLHTSTTTASNMSTSVAVTAASMTMSQTNATASMTMS